MTEKEIKQKNTATIEVPTPADTKDVKASSNVAVNRKGAQVSEAGKHRDGPRRQNMRRRRNVRRSPRARSEYDQKIVDIRRVTRVVAGGRRFSFSVVVVLGNRKGQVGVGVGKASDTALAIEKAVRNAKKNIITLKLGAEMTLPYESEAKYCASRVVMFPAQGKGMVAGSSIRNVLELAGVKDVGAKILSRSKNKLNNAQAALKALSAFT